VTELANRLMKGGRGAGVGIGFLAAVGGAAYGLSHSMYTGMLTEFRGVTEWLKAGLAQENTA